MNAYEGLNPSFAEACRRADAKQRHKANGHGAAEQHASDDTGLPFIDMSAWDSEPVPRREWGVLDRIPLRQPTLFSGEGAIGKTLVALQLSVAHVIGRDWLGTLPEPGPAIYFGAEDEADEIHRRLADIAAHYGARFADLAGRLHLLSFAGKDAILGVAGRDGLVKPTALFERLHQAAITIQPKLITLDTVSDIFIGNENDRAHVRQFVALLRGLAIDANTGLIICSHPSLTGITTGTGLSGSTGWHNSVRARMYLSPARTDEGEEPDPELRQLEFLKNNYGPRAERILVRWKNGVFIPEPSVGSLEKAAAEARADNVFLDILGRFNREGRNASDTKGPTHAPPLFSQEPEAKAANLKKAAMADAMRRLFASNRIHRENYRRNSQDHWRLTSGPKP
jgi:RecA-family ATPase